MRVLGICHKMQGVDTARHDTIRDKIDRQRELAERREQRERRQNQNEEIKTARCGDESDENGMERTNRRYCTREEQDGVK